jgi:hypothetical protein
VQATEGSKVREATQEDLFELLMLGYEFIKEGPDHLKPFEKDLVEERLANAIDNEDYVVLVLDINGSLEGALVGACISPWMMSEKFAVELAWFVRKSSRDGRGSIKMVKAYEAWAKSKGVTKICMSDLTKLQGLGKLYNRLGYTLSETSYIKEV